MQDKNLNKFNHRFPEHFLFWTYEIPQLLKSNLTTISGETIEFLERGEANLDNGPDYLNALIKIGDVQLRGDIEFHIGWQDWYRHGHDADRRYERVSLHILWEVPKNAPSKLLNRFPHFIISEFLTCSHDEWLLQMRQLTLQSPDFIKQKEIDFPQNFRFKKLAWQRFQRKCLEIRHWVDQYGWETTTYLGLARVLGYSKNSEPFVELVKNFSPAQLVEAVRPKQRLPHIYWCLLGRFSGLLPAEHGNHQPNAGTSLPLFQSHLNRQYQHIFPIKRQELVQWNFSRLRPQNNPIFRLAGFCQILYQFQNNSLFNSLYEIYSLRLPLPILQKKIAKLLCLTLHSNFKLLLNQLSQTDNFPNKTMGIDRCKLLQLNFLLPLLYVWAQINSSFGFSRYIEDLYFQFPPVDDNSFIRKIEQKLPLKCPKYAFYHQAILEYCLSAGLSVSTGITKSD
jgi:hypothetical protein